MSATDSTAVEAAADHVLGGIAHEVRNVLFATGMTLEALEATQPASDELTGCIEALRRQLEPLHALVIDLGLLYDAPTSGFAPASLNTMLRAAAEHCRSTRQGVSVAVTDDRGAVRVHVEQSSMLRALTHLLSYALQRSSTGFTVAPSVREMEIDGTPWVECVIADNGDALRAEDVDHVLDAYYPRSRGGFDARLATARRVVEAHGGTLHAEAGPGNGVRLVVRLPQAAPSQTTPPSER
jgi:two-component system sensor histidine kinase BaeS